MDLSLLNNLTKDLHNEIISFLPFIYQIQFNHNDPTIEYIMKNWGNFCICHSCKDVLITSFQDQLKDIFGTKFYCEYHILTEDEKEDLFINDTYNVDDDEESYFFLYNTIQRIFQRVLFEELYIQNKLKEFIDIQKNNKNIIKKRSKRCFLHNSRYTEIYEDIDNKCLNIYKNCIENYLQDNYCYKCGEFGHEPYSLNCLFNNKNNYNKFIYRECKKSINNIINKIELNEINKKTRKRRTMTINDFL